MCIVASLFTASACNSELEGEIKLVLSHLDWHQSLHATARNPATACFLSAFPPTSGDSQECCTCGISRRVEVKNWLQVTTAQSSMVWVLQCPRIETFVKGYPSAYRMPVSPVLQLFVQHRSVEISNRMIQLNFHTCIQAWSHRTCTVEKMYSRTQTHLCDLVHRKIHHRESGEVKNA